MFSTFTILVKLYFAPGVSLPNQETAAQLLQSTPLATAAAQTAEEAGPNLGCLTVRLAGRSDIQHDALQSITVIVPSAILIHPV